MNGSTRVLLVLAVLGVRTALALEPARHITELVHRVWDRRSGVPADISALAQTTDGYLWVGSSRGLYRFDGTQFQKFEPQSGARLPSLDILSLFAAADGRLWIGYVKGGASVLYTDRVTNYSSRDGFPEGMVNGFARERNGRVWVAASGGLAYLEGERWHTVTDTSGFPGPGAQALLIDHSGALWVAGQHRIVVLRPGSAKFELADEPYNGQVNQLTESPDGTVWMAETTRAVRPLKRPGETVPVGQMSRLECQERFPDTWQTEPGCRRSHDLEVYVGSAAILFDRDGGLWISTLGDGLRRAPYPSQLANDPIGEFSNALEQFTSKEGLSADYVTAIVEDREGSIWAATRDGIDQFRNGALAPVTLSSATTRLSIAPDDDGYVVALDSSSGSLFRLHDARRVNKLASPPFKLNWLWRDPFGSIWGSGMAGCRLVGGECATRLDVPGGSLGDQEVRLAVDGNQRLWAYNVEEGLFAFQDGRWRRFKAFPAALTGAVARTQYSDADGRIWFGFRDGRVLMLQDDILQVYSSQDGLNLGEIKAIASVGTHVWVGGEHGLALLRRGHFTSVLPYDAPSFDSVSGIVAANDGSLWLNEGRGVIRVSAGEVSAILQDSSHATHYDTLDTLDGLPGATEPVKCPTAIRGTDGRLWFTTVNGAAWVDPARLYRNKLPPPVVIQSIVADGRALPSSDTVELPAKTTALQIAYAGLSLSVPERVHFRYRLTGVDATWQSVGTRRTAYYTKLPPGSYDFQVVASNDAGVWNEAGAQLSIRIIPAWHQTWWFYGLAASLVCAALAALYQLRIAQVRAQTHRLLVARLSERERIARDLHDTLLQGLQGLILQFQAARNLLTRKHEDGMRALDVAIGKTEKAIEASRDAIQDLRPPEPPKGDLVQLLQKAGEELVVLRSASDGSPSFRVVVEGELRELSPQAHEEVYQIVRELIRNAFYHAAAQRIELTISYQKKQLCLRLRDDGKGIDPQVLAHSKRPRHWGLPGVCERARHLGARLEFRSQDGGGTDVVLVVPGATAYDAYRRSRPPA
jgi:signal transduction histidine kinase/ligand-binding sensor domain-containing protein